MATKIIDSIKDGFDDVKESGLTDKERNYRYGMIKGRIAETSFKNYF
ncbi:MAG: hypothetical protein IPN13_10875 [Bacteroidetes bacterium]|nr:hypothetical protein [Bacteroidota bacterium]